MRSSAFVPYVLLLFPLSIPLAPPATAQSCSDPDAAPVVEGEQKRWHPVTVTFTGPCTSEDADPNPFLGYRLTVTFHHAASGTQIDVPGFFAADGNAAETSATEGNKWRVHFTPRRIGDWTYEASFRTGTDISVNLDATAGSPTSFDGASGSFTIDETDKSGRDHRGKGILTYVGEHYLEFDDGSVFVKGGADSPENFLAYSEFDGTYNDGGSNYVRDYSPHKDDWTSGDPSWQGGNGKGMIGALNYLASEGMNAFSFLTMTIAGGDGRDVWPWTGPSEVYRYDISKLAQWDVVFTHSDHLGLFKHFKTQERENDGFLDNGDLGTARKLYYRELIARFSHHHALNWNLGEENANSDAQRKAYITYIKALDPYNHPIVVHTYPNEWDAVYDPLLGEDGFEGPSIQLTGMSPSEAHSLVTKWVSESKSANRPWVVSVDEPGTAEEGLRPDSDDNYDEAREVLWTTLFAGGDGIEWYFGYGYPNSDLTADDWRSRDRFWDQHRYALQFIRSLPVRTMAEDDDRLSGESGRVFSDGSTTFALYLPDGGTNAALDLPPGSYSIEWYDPRNGGNRQVGTKSEAEGGSSTAIGAPPADTNRDWVGVVSEQNPIPVELTTLTATAETSESLLISWSTASETNNAGFEVLHRPPGQPSFASAGFKPGAGTTDEPQSYDTHIPVSAPGTHTVRLKQVDTDGTTTLTDSVTVSIGLTSPYRVEGPSPNPTQTESRTTLYVEQTQSITVRLFDAMGRRVKTLYNGTARANRPIELHTPSSLVSGIYFLEIDGRHFTTTRKVHVVQ